MATRAQKIRLAIFFVVANSVLGAFLLFVAGAHLLKKREFYSIEFAGVSVGGLGNGAQVKYQGITVGRVEDTFISPEDIGTVVVSISVDPSKVKNAMRRDTRAMIYNLGITGLKYIELVPGTNQAEILPPGSRIEAGETFLADIDRQAEILTNKIELVLDGVNQLLGEQNRRQITRTLENAGKATAEAGDIIHQNRHHIDATFANIEQTSRSLARATTTLQATTDSLHQMLTGPQTRATLEDIQEIARHVHETVQGPLPQLIASVTQTSENAGKTFVHVDQTVLQSRNSLINAMQDLEEALQNVRELSEIIRDNPSILIRGGSRTDGPN